MITGPDLGHSPRSGHDQMAQAVLGQVAALAIEPWAGGQRDACVRIVAREISGRRIRALA